MQAQLLVAHGGLVRLARPVLRPTSTWKGVSTMNRYSYVSRMSVALLLAIGLLSGCAATEAPAPSVVQRMEGEKPAPPG